MAGAEARRNRPDGKFPVSGRRPPFDCRRITALGQNESLMLLGLSGTIFDEVRAAMDNMDEEERNHLAANIAWLESSDPDDWHRVALDFNWGEPPHILDWIVRQAGCDIATALTIFWQGEPSYWIKEGEESVKRSNGFTDPVEGICIYIANRIAAGNYIRSKIAYTPDTWRKKDYVDLVAQERLLTAPNFRSHPDLIRKRRGRRIENDAKFYSRYPQEFHGSVYCELPGDNPRSLALMERVRVIEQATLRLLPSWLRS